MIDNSSDRCGEREDALQDTSAEAFGFASAVAFQVELRLQGLIGGLDDLPEWFQELSEWPDGLFRARYRSDQRDAKLVEFGLERSRAVALVDHQHLARPSIEARVEVDHRERRFAFVDLRAGQRLRDWQA